MPCPIQIRETIQNSIDRKLPDPQAVMSQDAAKGIVDYLNKLWSSAITRMQQYSGLGGFRVIVNSLDDAVDKEFKKQEDAEKAFERDLDFFKGDEALMEQEQRESSFYNRPSNIQTQYQLPQGRELEEFVASEKTIRDLAARISDRIGIPVRFESDRTKKYKGKIEKGFTTRQVQVASDETVYEYGDGKDTAVINLAYATLDTPIHEVLGHPIIRSIKNINYSKPSERFLSNFNKTFFDNQDSRIYTGKTITYNGNNYEVYKLTKYSNVKYIAYNFERDEQIEISEKEFNDLTTDSQLYQNLLKELEYGKGKEVLDRIKKDYVDKTSTNQKYTLEEQQEEALVELLGLYTAGRLDNVKDGKLISLLKRLLKEMKAFMKSLIRQKEVEIDKLPDNITLGDIADLLAYSNSKLILPGNEVVYTTPDNQKFKSYAEASKHISKLANSAEEVDLSKVKLDTSMPDSFVIEVLMSEYEPSNILRFTKENNQWYISDNFTGKREIEESEVIKYYQDISGNYFGARQDNINNFIEKNKEYETSKEIIDEWKKVNNIVYNPEEVYSRGQEFVSVVGAYSNFDVNLMMQNLLEHIEDNERAGGKFAISAFTKPIDKKINHLEGGGGKIKFKIYPKSNDILWASNTDVFSGSVWDASRKVTKDKTSELLGVSYTKYPALTNVNRVKPNLAEIIDDLKHQHNELGIQLTGGNFRLEYDSDIPYTTKKIVDSINSILDQRYGKLIKPKIEKGSEYIEKLASLNEELEYHRMYMDEEPEARKVYLEILKEIKEIKEQQYLGIKPTQTKETLKESIESIESKKGVETYTSQALINTKIAKLKEVAKKYPRSLIRSEVVGISTPSESIEIFLEDDLPFQRIPSASKSEPVQKPSEQTLPSNASPKTLKIIRDFLEKVGVNVNIVKEVVVNGVKYDANGVAQVMQQLISVVEGKEAQALPEEAMHFAVSIIKQTNPKLYQKLMKEINGYDMLNQVFRTYGNDPLYQKDGKPDVIKLKEEAVAKVLVEKIINKSENIADTKENLATAQSWWRSIVDWIRDLLYVKSGFDQVTIDIISGKDIGTADQIGEEQDATFLQKSKQDNVYDSVVELSKRITRPAEGENKYVVDGKEVSRVSDIVKTYYDNRQKNQELLDDEYDTAVKELKKEKGTKGHADLEYAFSLFVDENGYLKDAATRAANIENDDYISQIGSQSFYETLRDNLERRFESYPAGTRFIKEVAIYNGKNLAGTVDFMAITPEGKIDILDWKFMNLNQEKYTDVPWYKIESWNIQMDEYKKILIANYGVQAKDFRQTRMIPILAQYSRGKKSKEGKVIELPRLTGVKIGDVNVQDIDEQEDFLLPVPTKDELTDNRRLDELLKKLNKSYETFAKEKVTPDRKEAKREQLQSLFKAIRRLQVKRDVRPLIDQAKLLEKKAEDLITKYKELYENPADPSVFSEQEINLFTEEIESLSNAFNSYIDIHNLLKDVVDGDVRNELRDVADEASKFISEFKIINEDFVRDVIAKREGYDNVLAPEKIVKGFAKWFSSTATLQVKTIQLLFTKANKAFSKAAMATQEESAKLMTLRDDYMKWAESKGITQKEFFSMIKKKDSNELIDQYKKEFYTEAKKAIKDGDVQWIKDNVDVSQLEEALEKKKNEELEKIKNLPRTGAPDKILREITKETADVERLYSINTTSSKGWFLYDIVKKFPLEKWQNEQWKELSKPENAPAKAFYDYIVDKNKEYADLGYISKQKERIFLPYVEGSIVEAAIKGESLSLGERFWRSISIDAGDVGYGQIDPNTGKPINTIPKYFTTPFEGVLSEDLFKTMSMYNEAALRYKYVSEIENQIRAIARVEKNKKTIMTNNLGKVARDPITDDVIYNPEGTEGNYELLDSMIKAIIYGQRYIDNQNFDAALLKIGSWGETINKKLGINVFPENLEGRQVTLNKIVDNLNNSFSIATLGFNLGSSLSNGLGGTFQSIINSGKYFTKTDFIAAETQVIVNKFNGEDKNKFLKAFEYFLPLTDNYNRDLAKKLSTNVVTEEGFQDFLMWMMRSADRTVQGANFFAFLNNSVVIDGKVLNAREYLRTLPEYKGRWSGSSQDRKAFDEKFEEDVKKLVEEKGVMKLATVEDGKFIIPGVDRMSNSVLELRRKVQQLSKDAMGNLSEDDVRLINMNILGKSFMVFKNWIPRLVDVRFGGLKYNAASDAYEWGRTRMMFSVLLDRQLITFKGLKGLILGDEYGAELMRKSFEKRAEKYELETGRKLEMDEAMFMDLMQSNVNAFARDLMFLASLMALTTAMVALAPDDDEDPLVKNQYNYARRLADKIFSEVAYFYNPTSLLDLVGNGPFPAMSLLDNAFKGTTNIFRELFALGMGDEEKAEDIKVIKYLMRTFPFANQMVGYLPLFYPDMAKDLGIRVQSNYGIR